MYSLLAGFLVGLTRRSIRVKRVSMGAKSADAEAMVVHLLFELGEFLLVLKHRQLAVRIAGIIADTQLHGVNVQLFEFFENLIQRELRQQRGKYANSHSFFLSSA